MTTKSTAKEIRQRMLESEPEATNAPGRPPVFSDRKRVTVYLEVDEKDLISRYAKASYMSISSFLRRSAIDKIVEMEEAAEE